MYRSLSAEAEAYRAVGFNSADVIGKRAVLCNIHILLVVVITHYDCINSVSFGVLHTSC